MENGDVTIGIIFVVAFVVFVVSKILKKRSKRKREQFQNNTLQLPPNQYDLEQMVYDEEFLRHLKDKKKIK